MYLFVLLSGSRRRGQQHLDRIERSRADLLAEENNPPQTGRLIMQERGSIAGVRFLRR